MKIIVFLLGFIFSISCTNVKYTLVSNDIQKEKMQIQKPFVLFEFSNDLFYDKKFVNDFMEAFKSNNLNANHEVISPLSFTDKNTVINQPNFDYLFTVTLLNSTINKTKYSYNLSTINYLLEIRNSKNILLKKCAITIKHPEYLHKNNDVILKTVNQILNEIQN
jgi:hypothetical protein